MKKRELRDEEHIAKRRTLGNIRFIGELFKLKVSEVKLNFLFIDGVTDWEC